MGTKHEEQASAVLGGYLGGTVAVNCSTTVQVVDLTTIPPSPAVNIGLDPSNQTVVGHYVTITADGGNVYYALGANFTTLNAIPNTVLYTTVNTTTGKVTVQGNELDVVPSGTWKDILVVNSQPSTSAANSVTIQLPNPTSSSPKSQALNSTGRYLALISASGNPIARIRQSST